ncbi:hypothetical protein AX14_003749, partial [Amanita brunnescens Koide BX004]
MAHKKKHLPCGTVIDLDDGHEQKFELSTVFSAAPSIMTTSYSCIQNEEFRRPFHAAPVTVPQAKPDASTKEPAHNQGASVMMEQFSKHLHMLQAAILSTKADDDVGRHCQCEKEVALYRCIDCPFSPILCGTCIITSHSHNPFHHVQKWNGLHFHCISLLELGQTIRLRHHGASCSNRFPGSKGRTTTVVHTNSIHQVNIEYCHCIHSVSEAEQLARSSLFPASFKRPEMVFTFAVLKQFHVLGLTAKVPAYDFFNALVNMTNNAFPKEVPDHYHEFLRAARAHGIDRLLSHHHSNSLAVRCPACPEPGFNVENAEIQAAAKDEIHKYTLFLSTDGNFRLQRKNKRGNPDNVALNRGNVYFVETEKFKEYLQYVKPLEDSGTCAHLQAVHMQNIVKFKNAVVTGVVGVQCARHGFYMPQSMVDLTKGEAY